MKPPTAIRAICGRALPMEAEPPVARGPATTTAIIKERMAATRQNDSFRLRRLRSAIISGSNAMNFLQSGPVLPNARSTIRCRGQDPAEGAQPILDCVPAASDVGWNPAALARAGEV